MFNTENDKPNVFALCHKEDVASLRKNLKDDLKYVEAFVRQGYIGMFAECKYLYYKNRNKRNDYSCNEEKLS